MLASRSFAYNRGAHMGVAQGIAEGLMGRCAMKWSTAGTNRVCSRCLALKDTIVGYTDESGVTIPPLHPRCRCAIIYDEVATPRTKPSIPKITLNNYEDVSKLRSQAEFIAIANKLKPVIEQYTGRQSKWNGLIVLEDKGNKIGGKLWDCSIRLNPTAPEHALIHELIHSCSISYYDSAVFLANKFEEELTVEYLSQELAILESMPVVDSDYSNGVELIRELKVMLGVSKSDLEFASKLIKQPLGERWNWLWEQISDKMNLDGTIELGQQLMSKLEEISQWTT